MLGNLKAAIGDHRGKLVGIGTIDPNFKDKLCVFSTPENSTCFAVPILSQFFALNVEEVPLDTQYPEVPYPIDLALSPQLR